MPAVGAQFITFTTQFLAQLLPYYAIPCYAIPTTQFLAQVRKSTQFLAQLRKSTKSTNSEMATIHVLFSQNKIQLSFHFRVILVEMCSPNLNYFQFCHVYFNRSFLRSCCGSLWPMPGSATKTRVHFLAVFYKCQNSFNQFKSNQYE